MFFILINLGSFSRKSNKYHRLKSVRKGIYSKIKWNWLRKYIKTLKLNLIYEWIIASSATPSSIPWRPPRPFERTWTSKNPPNFETAVSTPHTPLRQNYGVKIHKKLERSIKIIQLKLGRLIEIHLTKNGYQTGRKTESN